MAPKTADSAHVFRLTEIKMNENEYDILCKRLDFFFQKIVYSTTLVLGNFSSGVFLKR